MPQASSFSRLLPLPPSHKSLAEMADTKSPRLKLAMNKPSSSNTVNKKLRSPYQNSFEEDESSFIGAPTCTPSHTPNTPNTIQHPQHCCHYGPHRHIATVMEPFSSPYAMVQVEETHFVAVPVEAHSMLSPMSHPTVLPIQPKLKCHTTDHYQSSSAQSSDCFDGLYETSDASTSYSASSHFSRGAAGSDTLWYAPGPSMQHLRVAHMSHPGMNQDDVYAEIVMNEEIDDGVDAEPEFWVPEYRARLRPAATCLAKRTLRLNK